ncbi:ryncolin-2-like [Acanthaster planci]|uniref:Ryncolin-2-like n=1 Tax=Acanthaster planci TaxID=133434 RepID=A0A8B7Z5G8_ACAPL|nr:ryncolin-2-like [Acanthaster planci]
MSTTSSSANSNRLVTKCRASYSYSEYTSEVWLEIIPSQGSEHLTEVCGRDCTLDPRCASYNYQASGGVCELSNVSRIESPVDLVELGGSFYFDRNKDTLLCSARLDVDNSTCQMLYRAGHRTNGVYTIYPSGHEESGGAVVYCDMETDGGGWMVVQRRQDGSGDFYRTWAEYESGFGNLTGEFWSGNRLLHNLTASGEWQLIVNLEDWEDNTAWAEYGEFGLSGEEYRLRASAYNPASTAGDSLALHNGKLFTTKDHDNDGSNMGNCAHDYQGAWWFVLCLDANLNGPYHRNGSIAQEGHGVIWSRWKGYFTSLKRCSMKIREVKCYNRLG